MKTIKKILGWVLLPLIVVAVGWNDENALASGVGGMPFNPLFGVITATSEALTGASTAASYTATGTVQGATIKATGQVQGSTISLNSGGISSSTNTLSAGAFTATGALTGGSLSLNSSGITSSGSNFTVGGLTTTNTLTVNSTSTFTGAPTLSVGAVVAAAQKISMSGQANNYVKFNSNTGFVGGNSCIELDIGGSLWTAVGCAATSNLFRTVLSNNAAGGGTNYVFAIANNGTTCSVASGSFPSGWSVSRTGAGTCQLTYPSVSDTTKVFVFVTARTSTDNCTAGGPAATTVNLKCYTAAGVADDAALNVQVWDGN